MSSRLKNEPTGHAPRFTALVVLLWILLGRGTPSAAATLNGIYTIDPGATATSTNFRDFSSAIAYLTGTGSRTDGGPANSAPFGVSGPVVFMVASGTYTVTAMIEVPVVDGTSNVNTVTFDGGNGNASTRIITGLLPGTAVFGFNSCKYVGIRNLTLTNTAGTNTVYSGVGITGSTSSNAGTGCFVNNCVINLPNTNSTYLTYGITVTPSASAHGLGTTWVDSLRIDSNVVNGGYLGFYMQGPSTISNARNRDIKIRGNSFINAHYQGIYFNYVQNGIDIMYNTVIMDAANGNNALYMYYCYNHFAGNASHRIIGNKLSGGYSNQMFNITGLNTNPTKIHSNMVMNMRLGTNYGFAIYNGSGQNGAYEIFHNTISISNASGGYGIHFHAPIGASLIKNNIFAVTDAFSTATPLHIATTLAGNVVNYNIYYNRASSTLLYRTGTTFYPTTYRSVSGGGDSSFNLEPAFVNAQSDLHLQDPCASTGVNLSSVATHDADGQPYSAMPHIGADHIPRLATDLAVTRFVTPQSPITTGSQDVIFTVKNLGTGTVNWFDAGYKHNGNMPITTTFFTTLNACDTTQAVFSGWQQASLTFSNNISAFTYSPNSVVDSNASNDTVRAILTAPLNGNYTIGGTAPDFANFSQATAALQYGISGPVTFHVAPGTYNEQVNVTGPIPGSSPTNTITFEGIDKATRTIAYNAAVSPAVVKISTKYVTIRNFSIVTTNPTSGIGVFIAQGAHGCRIKSCHITAPTHTAMTCLGILVGSIETAYNNGYARVDSLEIDSNIILNGYIGIVSDNRSNFNNISLLNKIRNNTILNSYATGIYLYAYQNGVSIEYNTIVPSQAYQTNDGIYLYQLKNHTAAHPMVINGNRIYKYGYRGIVVDGCANLPSSKGSITNNMVGGGQRYGYAAGIKITGSDYWYIVNNSINVTYPTLGREYGALQVNMDLGLTISNNVLAVSTTSPGLPMHMIAAAPDTMDHNIFYRVDTSDHVLLQIDTTYYNSANFRGASGSNGNSTFDLPAFVHDTDLHTSDGCRRGMTFPFLLPDFDGQPRATIPAIGADEVPALSNDLAVDAVLSPAFPVASGSQNVVARVRNSGANTVTSFTLSYKLNSGAAVNMSWTGSLGPCDTVTLIFSGANQVNIPATGRHTLKVYTHNPNGTTDPLRLNDTITKTLGAPLNGTYIVGTAPSDFATIKLAVSTLNDIGVSGPVTFNIKTGTYADSLRLPMVAGSSTTNNVVFKSLANHRDSVLISSNGNVTLRLEASNISFKNVSIRQESLYGTVMTTSGTIGSDTLYNCVLTAPVSNTAGGGTLKSEAAMSDGLIRKCLFTGSYGGITLAPAAPGARMVNCTFDSNIVQNAWYSPFYIVNSSINLKIRNNELRCNGPYNTTWMNFARCDSAFDFVRNTVTTGGNVTTVNMVFSNNAGNASSRIRISENKFVASGSAQVRPAFSNENHYMDIFNNEMLLKQGNISLGFFSSNIRFFHNTVHSGLATLTINQSNCSSIVLRNNIMSCAGTGPVITWADLPLTGVQSDYNDLHTNGPNLMYWQWLAGGPFYANLYAWRAASGHELNSVSYRPPYISDTSNLSPLVTDSAGWVINGRGMPTDWVINDRNGVARSTRIPTGPVDPGAYEFTPVSAAPVAIAVPATPSLAISTTAGVQLFTLGFDTVAKINWSPGSTPPSAIRYRRYGGVLPKQVGDTTGLKYMYFYDDVSADSVGPFSYTTSIYYKTQYLGNTTHESNLIVAKKQTNSGWSSGILTSSVVDTIRDILTSPLLNSFSLFTGTESTSPLPVELIKLTGRCLDKDAELTWVTSREWNSKAFAVERSANGIDFSGVGLVPGAGLSAGITKYGFTDRNALNERVILYYRLLLIDNDGTRSHSQVIAIRREAAIAETITIYPNPFSSEISLHVELAAPTTISVDIRDISGKEVLSQTVTGIAGSNSIVPGPLSALQPGMYFVTVATGTQTRVLKLVKK